MKLTSTIIVCSFIFICNSLFSQNINAEIIYKKKGNLSINKKINSDNNSEASALLKSTFSNMDNLEYKLYFNKESSIFTENEYLEIDNLNNEISVILSKSFGGTKGLFYINIKSKALFNQKELDGKYFIIKTPFSNFKWVVTTEQKKIGKYNCYKATRTFLKETVSGEKKVPVIAWFTPEIPFTYGPASYAGLPGLILEVEVENIVIYASKIMLNQQENQVIEMPEKGKIITEKEYNELEKTGFGFFKSFK